MLHLLSSYIEGKQEMQNNKAWKFLVSERLKSCEFKALGDLVKWFIDVLYRLLQNLKYKHRISSRCYSAVISY